MEELAEVIETRGNKALVKVKKYSACSKCDKDCGMAGASHDTGEIDVEITNSMDAEIGNYVKLGLGEKSLVIASIIVYLFPLLSLIGGYFLTNWLASTIWLNSGELTGIIGSVVFFFGSFAFIKLINLKLKVSGVFQPKMIEVLK